MNAASAACNSPDVIPVRSQCGAASPAGRETNVGAGERLVSLVAGGSLLLWGLSRRSLPGAGLAVLGGSLVYRGATGYCALYHALGVTGDDADARSTPLTRAVTGRAVETIAQSAPDDIVDEASELSFPASDPPSYTAGR